MTPDELSYEGCINAVSAVGMRYIQNLQLDPATSIRFVRAGISVGEIPDWVESPKLHVDKAGPIAREALRQMVDSGGRLQKLAQAAIDEEFRNQGQALVEVVLGGMFLLALVSKISYSKEEGITIAPGFPQLAEVLDKAAKLLSSVIGGAQVS